MCFRIITGTRLEVSTSPRRPLIERIRAYVHCKQNRDRPGATCATRLRDLRVLRGDCFRQVFNGSLRMWACGLDTGWGKEEVSSRNRGRRIDRFTPGAAVSGLILTAEADGIYAYESGVDMTRKLYRIDTANAQGVRIGSTQNLDRAIDIATMVLSADMLVLTESSRSAAYYAAYSLDHETRKESAIAVSVAKSYTSDACREVGNKAIQVHGGMGFTWENDLHLYYRRAKASEVMFGDARTHRERIAGAVIG